MRRKASLYVVQHLCACLHDHASTNKTSQRRMRLEEKKNTRDNFELHLELGNRRNKGFVLILRSFVPKTELKSAR